MEASCLFYALRNKKRKVKNRNPIEILKH